PRLAAAPVAMKRRSAAHAIGIKILNTLVRCSSLTLRHFDASSVSAVTYRTVFILALATFLVVAACSGASPGAELFGPEPQTTQSESGNEPNGGAEEDGGSDATTNLPPAMPTVDAGNDSGSVCPPNKMLCSGTCVALDDPAYGCGSCTPCRATAIGRPTC